MTLVLEKSWNSKKKKKKSDLSSNCPGILKKISLIITKVLENDRNSFLDAVHSKNQENCEISNRKQSAVSYLVVLPPWYSILFKYL